MALQFSKPTTTIGRTTVVGSFTIAAAATESGTLATGAFAMFGIVTPAALTGTSLTFRVSTDGAAFVPLYDSDGVLVTLPVVASRGYDLPGALAPWAYVRIVSSAAEGAQRVFPVAGKG